MEIWKDKKWKILLHMKLKPPVGRRKLISHWAFIQVINSGIKKVTLWMGHWIIRSTDLFKNAFSIETTDAK